MLSFTSNTVRNHFNTLPFLFTSSFKIFWDVPTSLRRGVRNFLSSLRTEGHSFIFIFYSKSNEIWGSKGGRLRMPVRRNCLGDGAQMGGTGPWRVGQEGGRLCPAVGSCNDEKKNALRSILSAKPYVDPATRCRYKYSISNLMSKLIL